MPAVMRYQPQGLTRIAPGSPLARGLVSAATLAGHTRDALAGVQWSVVANTTPMGFAGAPRGLGMLSRGATPSSVTRPCPAAIATPTALTIRYRLYFRATVPAYMALVSFGDTPGDGAPAYYCRFDGSSLNLYFAGNYRANIPVQVETEYIVTQTYDGTTHRVYLNGALVATIGAGWSGATKNIYIGTGYNGANAGQNYLISDFALWNRALSGSEVQNDARNPWQLFDAGSSSSAYQAATGMAASGTTASLAGTLGAAGLSAAAAAPASAALSSNLGAAGVGAAGAAAAGAAIAGTLGAAGLAAAGVLPLAGTLALALAPAALASAGGLPVAAAAAPGLAPAAVSTDAALAVSGAAAAPLAAAALDAGGNLGAIPRNAALAAALAPAAVGAAGSASIAVALAGGLAAATLGAGAGLSLKASLTAALSPARAGGAAAALVAAQALMTLSPARSSAAGVVMTPVAAALGRALSAAGLVSSASAPAGGVLARSLGAVQAAGAGSVLARLDAGVLLGALLAAGVMTIQWQPPPLLRSSGLHAVMRRPAAPRTMRRNPRAL